MPKPLLVTVAVLFLLALLSRMSASSVVTFVFVVGVVPLIVAIIHSKRVSDARKSARLKASNIVNDKLENLTRRRAQLVRQDAYGTPILDKWTKEVDYFIESYIFPTLTSRERPHLQAEQQQLVDFINQCAEARMKEEPVFKAFSDEMTPSQFEGFCAEQLQRAGWNAQVTMRSRDQSVNVVAEKAGKRIVLQCKWCSGSVGHGAVQGIAVGRAHERAHYGAVVTNGRFTAPAVGYLFVLAKSEKQQRPRG